MPEAGRIECDVAVIGAGVAGMIAAVRAAQGGLRTVVLEKLEEDRYVCNSRLTAGVWHCCATDIPADPGLLYRRSWKRPPPPRAPTWHRRSPATGRGQCAGCSRWASASSRVPYSYQSFVLAPPSVTPQGCEWKGRGGDVMLRALEAELKRLGGQRDRRAGGRPPGGYVGGLAKASVTALRAAEHIVAHRPPQWA
ncbi:hypothetical protein GCM10023144_22390 [Pigmentiphaga soli]|uniref:FAD-dependent oxidoreductase 2 FAD-binding domain-containing protein n=1 Tax=Pigmentiphaga soli TaxID=1007095 RepID=A0ABP8H027_9BURK